MTEQDLIDKILKLDLPKEIINESSTRYYDTLVKEIISKKNRKEFFIAENDTIYFLKIQFFNWYARGPSDVEHSVINEVRYYIMDDEWTLLSEAEYNGLGSAKGLVWKKVQINIA